MWDSVSIVEDYQVWVANELLYNDQSKLHYLKNYL